MFRVLTFGFLIHFKQESQNPFYLWIVVGTPLIYATMVYFLFDQGRQPGSATTAALGSSMMGVWSLTTTAAAAALHRQRRLGVLELLVAVPTPFWMVVAPITVAISAVGIYSLAAGLLYVRVLFDAPVEIVSVGAFVLATLAAVGSIGMLGFLCASIFVRFRAAWLIGNMFEFPVWTICGLLVPIALLPGWIEPVAWALAPTWGMRALRAAALGTNPWGDIVACVVLSVAYAGLGAILLRVVLRSARENATLGLT